MKLLNVPFYLLILSFFMQVNLSELEAQEYSYRHYTVLDGLPQNQITYLFQDREGYLWVATKGGVGRFDGHSFTNYTIHDGLLANHVLRVLEDTKGRINFWTYKGMSRLEKDTIVTVFLQDTIPMYNRFFFVERSSGTEWWHYNSDHFRIFSGRKQLRQFTIPDELKEHRIFTVIFDEAHNKYWLAVEHLGIVTMQNGKIKQVVKSSNASVMEVAPGELIINVGNEIIPVDEARETTESAFELKGLSSGRTMRGLDGKYYTVVGLEHISVFDGKKSQMLKKKFNYINMILLDSENNLWIATETGLFRRISEAFKNFTVETGCPEYVWSIVEDDQKSIWFASYGNGLCKFQNGIFEKQYAYQSIYSFFKGKYFYTGAKRFSDGDLYFPVKNQGLLKYDGKSFSIPEGLPIGSGMDVLEDTARNQIVLASTAGLVIWKGPGDIIVHQRNYFETRKFIKSMEIDKFGRYWLGGEYLLEVFDGQSFTDILSAEPGLVSGAISIHKDHRQNLWLGTTSGLYFYDYKKFRSIVPGLLRSQVSSFTSIDSTQLFMGVSEGLAVLDLKAFYQDDREKVDVLEASRGFLGFDCIRNGILTDTDGQVWVAASDRVVKYDPKEFRTDTIPPLVRIGQVIAHRKYRKSRTERINPEHSAQQVKLLPHFRDIRINYHAIHFYAPEYIKYKYRLVGYDDSWSDETTERFASYTNLRPTEYTFEVLACNRDGIWSPDPARFSFSITPALWQTVYFVIIVNLLVFSLLILAVYLIYRAFRKRKVARQATERQISELQLKTIRSQMDPHFTFNALNSISSVIYKEDKEKAYRYFTRFARLIRSSLEVSDKIARSLYDEIEFSKDYLELEKIRFGDDFDYYFVIDEGINQQVTVPKMIVQNYVENAVKHGLKHKETDRKLWVTISKDHSMLIIEIKDNGVGRREAEKRKGFSTGKGLKIMNSIYDLYYKLYKVRISHNFEDLLDPRGKAAGTKILVKMPLPDG